MGFLFDGFLSDNVLVQELLYFKRLGDLIGSAGRGLDLIVFENGIADGNAFVADVGSGVIAGRRDELADYVLTLMTKRTPQSIIGSGTLQAVFSYSAFGPGRDTKPRSRLPPGRGTLMHFVPIIT